MIPKTFILPRGALAVALLTCCGPLCRGQEQQAAASAGTVPMKLVKGIPFSAKVVTESTQTLADSNRIVRKSRALVARDSDGRTRREQKLVGTEASIIFIQDPVSGFSYVLDTRDRSVRKASIQMLETIEPPVNSLHDVESLGAQFVEGFLVEGTRLRQTIPADKAGSVRSVEVISETWYCPQLQTIAMNKTIDPRVGEINYIFTDIQLGDPAQSLFQIPKDYIVREDSPGFRSQVLEKSKDK